MTVDLEIRAYRKGDDEAVIALWNDVLKKPEPRNEPRFVIAKKLAMQPELFFVDRDSAPRKNPSEAS